jgi:hypothetical protein
MKDPQFGSSCYVREAGKRRETYNFMDVPRASGRLKDEDICYNNKIRKQIECDER